MSSAKGDLRTSDGSRRSVQLVGTSPSNGSPETYPEPEAQLGQPNPSLSFPLHNSRLSPAAAAGALSLPGAAEVPSLPIAPLVTASRRPTGRAVARLVDRSGVLGVLIVDDPRVLENSYHRQVPSVLWHPE